MVYGEVGRRLALELVRNGPFEVSHRLMPACRTTVHIHFYVRRLAAAHAVLRRGAGRTASAGANRSGRHRGDGARREVEGLLIGARDGAVPDATGGEGRAFDLVVKPAGGGGWGEQASSVRLLPGYRRV